MIMDSNVPRKVPAISTSEDSREMQPSSSDYPPIEISLQAAVMDDESRDMGEIQCDHKLGDSSAVQDRDDAAPTFQEEVALKDTAASQRIGEEKHLLDYRERNEIGELVTVKEEDDDRLNTTTRVITEDPLPLKSPGTVEEEEKHATYTVNEASHSLLPSPSASFDHAMNAHPLGHPLNPKDGSSATDRPYRPRHRRSPANTFPLPSPKTNHLEFGDDDASFNLFNQSFDSMSDTAAYLRDLHQGEMNGSRGDDGILPSYSMLGLEDRYHQLRYSSTPFIDISLPTLAHPEYSIDNVSHIRVYSEESKSRRHSLSGLEPIPVHFPPESDEDTYRHAHGPHNFSDQAPLTNAYGGSLVSNPYFVMRCARKAFSKCTFLFSCLSAPDSCAVNVSASGSFHYYQAKENVAYYESTLSAQEMKTAALRVGAAICAFGGSIKPQQVPRKGSSIFRPKGASLDESNYARTPLSGVTYEEGLRHRYFLSGNHISWEIEEDPPLELSNEGHLRRDLIANMNTSSGSYAASGIVGPPLSNQLIERSQRSSTKTMSPTLSVVEMSSSGTEPPKMKYRCKLCSQPKQNHNCPYRQSLQRSIGITVHAAVNSYTAHEPGELTPALSEMNNFISYDSDHGASETPYAASLPSKAQRHRHSEAHITPETSFRPMEALLSPQSSLSTRTPSPETTSPTSAQRHADLCNSARRSGGDGRFLKRSHSEIEADSTYTAGSPFIGAVPLRPEQYRAVTHSTTPETVGAYQYPSIPMSSFERKKLVDTLFILCREIPNLCDECSSILCDARMRGMWDLAVAELLAQLVVGFYCQEGDRRLDGLQQYLLFLGVSC